MGKKMCEKTRRNWGPPYNSIMNEIKIKKPEKDDLRLTACCKIEVKILQPYQVL